MKRAFLPQVPAITIAAPTAAAITTTSIATTRISSTNTSSTTASAHTISTCPMTSSVMLHISTRRPAWVGGSAAMPPPMIRRTVSEGPHAAMNATHSKKRASPFPGVVSSTSHEDVGHKRVRMEPSSRA
ncbi:hypothetical protein PINS_up002974 [Pythium insidiosum]|nr:hypothetical protein PINS_up002974 [Pythium insidiosum]